MKRCRQRVDAGEPRHSYQSQAKQAYRKEFSIHRPFNFLSTPLNNGKEAGQEMITESGIKLRGQEEIFPNAHPETSLWLLDRSINQKPTTPKSPQSDAPLPTASLGQSGSRRKSLQPKRQGAASLGSSPSNLSPLLAEQHMEDEGECDDQDPAFEQGEAVPASLPAAGDEIKQFYSGAGNEMEHADASMANEKEQSPPKGGTEAEKLTESKLPLTFNSSGEKNPTGPTAAFPAPAAAFQHAVGDSANPLLSANKLQEIFNENHRRFYALLLEQQQRKQHSSSAGTQPANALSANGAVAGREAATADQAVAFNLYLLQQQHLQEMQRNFHKLAAELKERLISTYSESAERVVDDSFANALKLMQQSCRQQLFEIQQQYAAYWQRLQQPSQQQQPFTNGLAASLMSSGGGLQGTATGAYGGYGAYSPAMCNSFFAAAAAFAANNARNQMLVTSASGAPGKVPTMSNGDAKMGANGAPSSIFPTALQQQQVGAGGQLPHQMQHSASASLFPPFNLPSLMDFDLSGTIAPNSAANDDSPRKKRSKVTDGVRGPRSMARDTPSSIPASGRSTPHQATGDGAIGNYFPPTMVSSRHPFLLSTGNGDMPGLRMGSHGSSPVGGGVNGRKSLARSSDSGSVNEPNSEDDGDGGSEEGRFIEGGLYQRKCTLTHVHLRKAKLMFFYTRYPTSAVLKTYFPDIHFNKHNTAQLVKWFSNFREFYYMQMEKFAKQALAEGIRNRSEIHVIPESEIYKQLNQHYNRNNIIQPPERLRFVIQETLKEFFSAIQLGKDVEPSWKKAIYKVIQQYDDPIPDYFKDPNFIDTLEQAN